MVQPNEETPEGQPPKPLSAAYDPNFISESRAAYLETVKEEKGIPQTLASFIVGVIFGVVLPLLMKNFLADIIELFSPSQPLPTMGEPADSYGGTIDLTSPQNIVDQLTAQLASYVTALWFIALIYLFPIIYQLRIAVIYGKLTQVLCLAITILGPPAVLIMLPLWGEILA